MAAYSNMDCQALAQEYLKEQATLSAVSKQQNGAATGDAFGVFLIGVPMSSTFGGDKKGQLSITNGKVKAIEANLRGEECNVPTVGKPVAKKPR
ncbi:hypothetical protein [Agrobacterium sp. SORGH_AS 787]|uniref:hypothetical protein n=1 Tax=Agrobacterium sp. SORGH_AS 787 TaxID=3041775 RepID=UPI0032B8340A